MLTIDADDRAFIAVSAMLKAAGPKIAENSVTRVATFFERTAKENNQKAIYLSPASPYYPRSGKTRQSITRGVIGPLQQRVYMGAKHGKYLEFGTGIYHTPDKRDSWLTSWGGVLPNVIKMKGMKARPFWVPAIKTTEQNVPRILELEARNALK